MDIHFDNLKALHLLWSTPLLLGVIGYGFHRRRRALQTFAGTVLLDRLTERIQPRAAWVQAALAVVGLTATVLALTGPKWGLHYEDIQRRGIDIMFCLDASRSMLAEDVTPNRLERAKQFINDVVLQLGGDRAGLVAFAGDAVLQCPLTVDYGTFRMVLRDVDVRSSARGGTLIGDAVRTAVASFTDTIKKHKAIILMTDGEDQSSYPVEAAAQAFAQGIRVYTIGLGDLNEGSRIPITRHGQRLYLQHNGQEVWSKLDAQTLQQMARAGGGEFIPAGTSQVDLGEFYTQVIAAVDQRDFEMKRVKRYDVQYQWFAAAAFVLLLIDALISRGRRMPRASLRIQEHPS